MTATAQLATKQDVEEIVGRVVGEIIKDALQIIMEHFDQVHRRFDAIDKRFDRLDDKTA